MNLEERSISLERVVGEDIIDSARGVKKEGSGRRHVEGTETMARADHGVRKSRIGVFRRFC